MAEAILSNLAKKILEGLGSLILEEIGKEIGLASGIKKELRKLEESLSTIDAILLDAEKKGAMNNVVKGWLRKLKDVAYDAEDVLDEFATEALRQKVELPKNKVAKQVRRCFSSSNPLVFRLKMGHRIKDIIERLDRIQKDASIAEFQFKTQNVDLNMNGEEDDSRHTVPFVIESEVLGREKDKKNLVELLMESSGGHENVLVIPIIGIGGLGKTTLAQCVYNDERVKKHFELRMWVCVSFDFDVVKLAKKILESLTNDKCGDLGANQAKLQLVEKLSGKRYLLVLDDVWNDHLSKWENIRTLLIGGAMKGSMIMVTTRSEEVASIMHPIKVFYHLKGLDENDCESLFNERAFGREGKEANHPELVEIGKGIVKKCGGVPLAAKALGSLLRLNRNKKDWLNVLNTEIWNLEGEQEILPALRISYNQLPSHLKQCFAYCSLFPQDHEIEVDDLIHQWMAHGFISSSSSTAPPPRSSSSSSSGGSHRESLEDIGNRYFMELYWRSFFQELTEEHIYGFYKRKVCKMHDLVHNLARWVAGVEWSEVVIDSDSSPSSRTSWSSGVRHMVLFHYGTESTDTQPLPLPFPSEKAQKLRTLYVQDDYRLAISAGFFSISRGLRVLKLSGLRMEHVPSSIGYLEQLRYLDLSDNYFEALPNSICRLYNLQTLRLNSCPCFNEWPRVMTKMVSLRHIESDGWNKSLEYMPRGLGQLTSLRTLGVFVVDDPNNTTTRRSRTISGGLGELHGLNQLRGRLCIKGLGNVRDASDAEKANLKGKSELRSLFFGFLSSSVNANREDEQVLENLEPHPSLKELTIWSYEGVKMPRWMIIPSINSFLLLSNLVELQIWFGSNLKCLPLIGEFPCLRTLSLYYLNALESICNKVVVRGGGGGEALLLLFPSLQHLSLQELPNLKRWTINPYSSSSSIEATTMLEEEEEEAQHNNNNQFHFLSSMFPRLTHLSLKRCPKLTRVPVLSVAGIQHLTSLQKLTIDGLERLVSLPDCPAPATLEELVIRNCPTLVRLPDRFFENLKLLSKFQIKECSSMELTSLPEGIQHLTALKQLKIGSCGGLATLSEGIGNLASLQLLKIHNCSNLMSLPEGIQQLTALETLSICNCPGLRALPNGLGNLSSLQKLDFNNCPNLMSLPEGIQHLTALKMLSIQGCSSLNILPEDLGSSLTALEELLISGLDGINQLPESLGNLTALKELSVCRLHSVNQLPESLGNLTALEELSISELHGVNQLPESLGNLTALKRLSISRLNAINQLPESLGNLTGLEELSISELHGVNQLPECLGNLTALKRLSMSKLNGLNQLPESLGNLTALEELSISELHGVNQLPESLGNLTALKRLSMSKLNGLNQLAENLGNLSSLERFKVDDCSNLSSLPKGIQHLTALEYMRIERCPGLKALPHGLRNLASRGLLEISDCPSLSLPRNQASFTSSSSAVKCARIQNYLKQVHCF